MIWSIHNQWKSSLCVMGYVLIFLLAMTDMTVRSISGVAVCEQEEQVGMFWSCSSTSGARMTSGFESKQQLECCPGHINQEKCNFSPIGRSMCLCGQNILQREAFWTTNYSCKGQELCLHPATALNAIWVAQIPLSSAMEWCKLCAPGEAHA